MLARIASALLFVSVHAGAAPLCTSKLDMLFVIDNSSSMAPLQQKLSDSARSLFEDLNQRGYDFRVAVTTSDAYLAAPNFSNNANLSLFRDGSGSIHTGIRIIDNRTPNLYDVFAANVNQGSEGSGDERAFSSVRASFLNPGNLDFLRPDSFLSIVILSDEDDFSSAQRNEYSWLNQNGIKDHDYSTSVLDPVDNYRVFLDDVTHSTPYARRYSVSAIAVLDDGCLQTHIVDSPSSIVGQRYMDIVFKTDGALGSLCEPTFAPVLQRILQKIGTGF